MECFIYRGGCGMHVLSHLKEELVWAIDKQFLVIVMLLKQLYY